MLLANSEFSTVGKSRSCDLVGFRSRVGKAHRYSLHRLLSVGNSLWENGCGVNEVIQIAENKRSVLTKWAKWIR